MSVIQEILDKVKAKFNAPPVVAPVAPVAAAAPPTPPATAPVGTPYKLQDGTDITIAIDDPAVSMTPDVGDLVSIAGAPAPAGDYTLEDGTTFTTDGTGAITVIAQPEPLTQPDFAAPPALTLEDRIKAIEVKINAPATMAAIEGVGGLTSEVIQAMYAKFATGSSEERISNLEIMIKALMDNSFGYQIRQGTENQAIEVYKTTISGAMSLAEAKITKQDEVITGLFEIVEKLIAQPSADPVALTGDKKDRFDRANKREKALANLAESFTKLQSTRKY